MVQATSLQFKQVQSVSGLTLMNTYIDCDERTYTRSRINHSIATDDRTCFGHNVRGLCQLRVAISLYNITDRSCSSPESRVSICWDGSDEEDWGKRRVDWCCEGLARTVETWFIYVFIQLLAHTRGSQFQSISQSIKTLFDWLKPILQYKIKLTPTLTPKPDPNPNINTNYKSALTPTLIHSSPYCVMRFIVGLPLYACVAWPIIPKWRQL